MIRFSEVQDANTETPGLCFATENASTTIKTSGRKEKEGFLRCLNFPLVAISQSVRKRRSAADKLREKKCRRGEIGDPRDGVFKAQEKKKKEVERETTWKTSLKHGRGKAGGYDSRKASNQSTLKQ